MTYDSVELLGGKIKPAQKKVNITQIWLPHCNGKSSTQFLLIEPQILKKYCLCYVVKIIFISIVFKEFNLKEIHLPLKFSCLLFAI